MRDGEQRWTLAIKALALLRADPSLKGILVRTAHGPVQQAYLANLGECFAITPVPVSVSSERLMGGVDIGMSLAAGKPVHQSGLLDIKEGALLVQGAERLDTMTSSALGAHLDKPDAPATVLILMDESAEDETGLADSLLAERLAMMIELPALPLSTLQSLLDEEQTGMVAEKLRIDEIELSDSMLKELALLAQRLGVDSSRALLFAVRVARVHAALDNRQNVDIDDAAIAAQLVFAPRAITMESTEDIEEQAEEEPDESVNENPDDAADPPPPPEHERSSQQNQDPSEEHMDEQDDIGEQLLDAVAAALPQNVIANLVRGQKNNRKAGRDANSTGKGTTGRPTGVRRPRGPLNKQRLNIIETLKAAAPKQRLRGAKPNAGQRLQVRVEDFRVTRYKQPTRTTTVFVVDASGSAALNRLAEAKGAVELLLAECYVRRDRVALISFRGTKAQLELPPTRSLVRAKRELAGLPGGGGTPLASGLELASQVAQQLKQAGETPVLVIMTDGKANISRQGEASRTQAMEDAHQAARQLATLQIKCLFIDTAPRARPQARELATSLQATYLPLPSASSSKLPELIRA